MKTDNEIYSQFFYNLINTPFQNLSDHAEKINEKREFYKQLRTSRAKNSSINSKENMKHNKKHRQHLAVALQYNKDHKLLIQVAEAKTTLAKKNMHTRSQNLLVTAPILFNDKEPQIPNMKERQKSIDVMPAYINMLHVKRKSAPNTPRDFATPKFSKVEILPKIDESTLRPSLGEKSLAKENEFEESKCDNTDLVFMVEKKNPYLADKSKSGINLGDDLHEELLSKISAGSIRVTALSNYQPIRQIFSKSPALQNIEVEPNDKNYDKPSCVIVPYPNNP